MIQKWTKDMNTQFTKESMQMENKHMKVCSTALAFIHQIIVAAFKNEKKYLTSR